VRCELDRLAPAYMRDTFSCFFPIFSNVWVARTRQRWAASPNSGLYLSANFHASRYPLLNQLNCSFLIPFHVTFLARSPFREVFPERMMIGGAGSRLFSPPPPPIPSPTDSSLCESGSFPVFSILPSGETPHRPITSAVKLYHHA